MERSANKAAKQGGVTSLVQFDDDNLRAIAEVYKNEGNDEYSKKNFNNAIHFYTEEIKVNCKDEDLNAKLYSNRATAHFNLGNYSETVNDAKAAIELQPHFLKAFVRGKSSNSARNQSYSCVFIRNEKATDPNLDAMWVCTA
ncbi:tetratricopeptide repeat protein 4-like [Porites lutea]|uniref:tetratricopeptide repeat protein 4-like n=1 Tax=Porites lutea TaxID=51062 RepID=UPI003CC62176